MRLSEVVTKNSKWIKRPLGLSIYVGGVQRPGHRPQATHYLTWGEWMAALGEDEFIGKDKLKCPYFTHALRKGGKRYNRDVQGVDLIVADIDGADKQGELLTRLDSLFESFDEAGLAYYVYTTYSNGKIKDAARHKVRVLVPLDNTALPAEFKTLIKPATLDLFQGLADPKALKLSQPNFAPGHPPGIKSERWFAVAGPGTRALSLEALRATKLALQAKERVSAQPLSKEGVQGVVDAYSKSKGHQKWSRMLQKVVNGEPFSKVGSRESDINTLTRYYLSPFFFTAKTDEVVELFRPSVEAQARADEEEDWVDKGLHCVRERWEKNVSEVLDDFEEQLKRQEKRNAMLRKKAWQLTQETKRTAPVTAQEAAYACKESNQTREELTICIRHEKSIYFRVGRYWTRPLVKEEVPDVWPGVAAAWEMTYIQAPAPGKPIELACPEMPTPWVVNTIEASVAARCSHWDQKRGAFVEATCPMRPDLEPEFDEEVDEWLQALGGQYYPQLELWLASLCRLDHPCRILFLQGRNNTGKSLLVNGLAYLWYDRVAALSQVAGRDFNDAILRSPLVVAEESATGMRGQDLSRWLRAGTTERSRSINRKYRSAVHTTGSLRYIIASNNFDVITSIKEELGKDDIAALSDRFLHIPCGEDPYRVLKQYPTSYLNTWITKGYIARHALALAEKHKGYVPTDRLFTGEGSPMVGILSAIATGLKGEVISRVINCLRLGGTEGSEWLAWRDDGVVIDPGALHDNADTIAETRWKCSAGTLASAIATMSAKRTRFAITKKGEARRNGYLVNRQKIYAYCDKTGLMAVSEVRERWDQLLKTLDP